MTREPQDDPLPTEPVSGPEVRLPYLCPRLERLGDVRSNILGTSLGGGDSPIGKIGT